MSQADVKLPRTVGVYTLHSFVGWVNQGVVYEATHNPSGETLRVTEAGNYLLLDELGRGSFGIVYLALHENSGDKRAVKYIHAGVGEHEGSSSKRAERDALLCNLNHRNIVKAYDPFSLRNEATGDVAYFLPMELLRGCDLSKYLRGETRLPLETELQIFLDCCDALEYAASTDDGKESVTHRDIKPSNIFLCESESQDHTVKITDFGLARLNDQRSGEASSSNVAPGASEYRAPEYFLQNPFHGNEQSDIFSFGICLAYCLTGERPTPSHRRPEDWYRWVLRGGPVEIDATAEVFRRYPSLYPIVRRCTEWEPQKRYASFSELKRDLHQALRSLNEQDDTDEKVEDDATVSTQSDSVRRFGDYDLLARIEGDAAGAFARIWLARPVHDSTRQVVLKILRDDLKSEENIRRFHRESDILRALLPCPNVVDYIEHFSFEDEFGVKQYAIVLEYVPGKTLHAVFEEHPTGIPKPEAMQLFAGIARALADAHQLGYIHRDLNPRNVVCQPGWKAKVLDFGISYVLEGSRLSGDTLQGSWDYTAPERAYRTEEPEGEKPETADADEGYFPGDERTDIFSFGVCLYRALTGSLPFPPLQGSPMQMYAQFFHRAQSLSVDEVDWHHPCFEQSPPLRELTGACLEPNQGRRLSTAQEAVSVLLRELDTIQALGDWQIIDRTDSEMLLLADRTSDGHFYAATPLAGEQAHQRAREYIAATQGRDDLETPLLRKGTARWWYVVLADRTFAEAWQLEQWLEHQARNGWQTDQKLVQTIAFGADLLGKLHGSDVAHGRIGPNCLFIQEDDRPYLRAPMDPSAWEAATMQGDCQALLNCIITGLFGRAHVDWFRKESVRLSDEDIDNWLHDESKPLPKGKAAQARFCPPIPSGNNILSRIPQLGRSLVALDKRPIAREVACKLDTLAKNLAEVCRRMALRNPLDRVLGANRLLPSQTGTLHPAGADLEVAGLDHRYELVSLLDQGGFGIVAIGVRLSDGRRVAVKVPKRESWRFGKEIEILQRLSKDTTGIVQYIDHFEEAVPPNDDRLTILVMELLAGESLRKLTWDGAADSLKDILTLFAQYADTLHHCHQRRIIHRDVKPSNFMWWRDKNDNLQGKLLDFGVARDARATHTSDGLPPGTYEYMAPETVLCMRDSRKNASMRQDGRLDVFSLGVTLYRVLSGTIPYPQKTSSSSNAEKRFEALIARCKYLDDRKGKPFREWCSPALPESLRGHLPVLDVLDASLAVNPDERYQSMQEFKAGLETARNRIGKPVEVGDEAVAQEGNAAPAASAEYSESTGTIPQVPLAPAGKAAHTVETLEEQQPAAEPVGHSKEERKSKPIWQSAKAAIWILVPLLIGVLGGVLWFTAMSPEARCRRWIRGLRSQQAPAEFIEHWTKPAKPLKNAPSTELAGKTWTKAASILSSKHESWHQQRTLSRQEMLGFLQNCEDGARVPGRVVDRIHEITEEMIVDEFDSIGIDNRSTQNVLDDIAKLWTKMQPHSERIKRKEKIVADTVKPLVRQVVEGWAQKPDAQYKQIVELCSNTPSDWPEWSRSIGGPLSALATCAAGTWPQEWPENLSRFLPDLPPDTAAARDYLQDVLGEESPLVPRLAELRGQVEKDIPLLDLESARTARHLTDTLPPEPIPNSDWNECQLAKTLDELRSSSANNLREEAAQQLKKAEEALARHQWSSVTNPENLKPLFSLLRHFSPNDPLHTRYKQCKKQYDQRDNSQDAWRNAAREAAGWNVTQARKHLRTLKSGNPDSLPAVHLNSILNALQELGPSDSFEQHHHVLAETVRPHLAKIADLNPVGSPVISFERRVAKIVNALADTGSRQERWKLYPIAYPALQQCIRRDANEAMVRLADELENEDLKTIAGPTPPLEAVDQKILQRLRRQLSTRLDNELSRTEPLQERSSRLEKCQSVMIKYGALLAEETLDELKNQLRNEQGRMLVRAEFDTEEWQLSVGEQQNVAPGKLLEFRAEDIRDGTVSVHWTRGAHSRTRSRRFVGGGGIILKPEEPPQVSVSANWSASPPSSSERVAEIQVEDRWRPLPLAVEGWRTYDVRARAPGYSPWTSEIMVSEDTEKVEVPALQPRNRDLNIRFEAQPPEPLRLSVKTAANGEWEDMGDRRSLSVSPPATCFIKIAPPEEYTKFESSAVEVPIGDGAIDYTVPPSALSRKARVSWTWADWVPDDYRQHKPKVRLRGDEIPKFLPAGTYTLLITHAAEQTPGSWKQSVEIPENEKQHTIVLQPPPSDAIREEMRERSRKRTLSILQALDSLMPVDVSASIENGMRTTRQSTFSRNSIAKWDYSSEWLAQCLGETWMQWHAIWQENQSLENRARQLQTLEERGSSTLSDEQQKSLKLAIWIHRISTSSPDDVELPPSLRDFPPAERAAVHCQFTPNTYSTSTNEFQKWRKTLKTVQSSTRWNQLFTNEDRQILTYIDKTLK